MVDTVRRGVQFPMDGTERSPAQRQDGFPRLQKSLKP
jgi:hypothetical protein